MSTTYPPTMFDEFLPIYIIQPGNPDKLSLCIHQPPSQFLILPPHRLEHHLRTGLRWRMDPPGVRMNSRPRLRLRRQAEHARAPHRTRLRATWGLDSNANRRAGGGGRPRCRCLCKHGCRCSHLSLQLLLSETQRRELPREPVHMRLRLGLQGILQPDLLLSKLTDVQPGIQVTERQKQVERRSKRKERRGQVSFAGCDPSVT